MKPIRFHLANLQKHGVSPQEVEECLRQGKQKYFRKARRGVYLVIGQTASGRYLEVLYEDRPDERYVFHAMDAKPAGIRVFWRRGKRR